MGICLDQGSDGMCGVRSFKKLRASVEVQLVGAGRFEDLRELILCRLHKDRAHTWFLTLFSMTGKCSMAYSVCRSGPLIHNILLSYVCAFHLQAFEQLLCISVSAIGILMVDPYGTASHIAKPKRS